MEHHISFSSLSQFQNCSRAWHLQRILGKKQPQGAAASWGKAFETEVIKRMGIPTVPRTDGREHEDTVLEGDAQIDVHRAVDLYLSTPGHWNELPGSIVSQHPINLTPDQRATLCDENGVAGQIHLPFVGYIDLLRTEPNGIVRRVADLKTTSRAGLMSSWVLQVTLYALLLRARECQIHSIVRYQSKAKTPKPDTYTAVFYSWFPSEDAFKWAMNTVNSLAERCRIASEQPLNRMEANPGYWCSWCPEPQTCAAYSLSEIVPFSTSKDAKVLLAW